MAEAVERVELNRRLFLQLSGASLAACGLHIALKRPALAEKPDPASKEPDRFIIDGLTEAANDPDVQQYIRTGALPFWIAGMFVNVWHRNLNFLSLPPDLIKYYRQAGGASRDLASAQSVWETIPREIRMARPEALRGFHSGRDWSHFIPRSVGGSDSANAGIFEDSALNRSRGASPMTNEEIGLARRALRSQALVHAIRLTARVTVSGALVGAVTAGVFTVMEYGLWYQEGKIDRGELFDLVWKELNVGTAVGISIIGIIAGLVMIFPSLMAVVNPFVLPLTFATFAFVGYQFYAAAKRWEEAGFEPLLGAWDTTKEISKEAWERAATLFEKFQNASKRAWMEAKEISQWAWDTIQRAWDTIQIGADGITVNAGTVLQWVLNWFRVMLSPVAMWD